MYRELAPPPHLVADVSCTWISPDAPGSEPSYVVPDGCVDLVWTHGRLVVAGPDTRPVRRQTATAGLAGPAADVASPPTVVGLRFRPGRAGPVLGIAPVELTDARVLLRDVWGSSTDEIDAGIVADLDRGDPEAAAGRLAAAVTARHRTSSLVDGFVADVADEIFRTRGARPISSIATDAAMSERQLRRRCTTAFGYAPKTLARIARFQVALALLRGGAHPLAEVALLAGYADQAHLTREVVALSARSPRAHLPVPVPALV